MIHCAQKKAIKRKGVLTSNHEEKTKALKAHTEHNRYSNSYFCYWTSGTWKCFHCQRVLLKSLCWYYDIWINKESINTSTDELHWPMIFSEQEICYCSRLGFLCKYDDNTHVNIGCYVYLTDSMAINKSTVLCTFYAWILAWWFHEIFLEVLVAALLEIGDHLGIEMTRFLSPFNILPNQKWNQFQDIWHMRFLWPGWWPH